MLTVFTFMVIFISAPLVYYMTKEIVNYCLEELKYVKTKFEKVELYGMMFTAFTQIAVFLFAAYMFANITL